MSDCGRYRYVLERFWDIERPKALFVMLNPSTADADSDDPTIRRCISFARREECGGLLVVNLYAFRANKPADMWAADDPEGPLNTCHHACALKRCGGPIIAAWGATGDARGMGARFLKRAARLLRPDVCLGTTGTGAPRHPLYVRGDAPLIPI